MLSVGSALAIFAGAGGIVLAQVGSLIPSRKDFMAALKLRKSQCVEECASSHCFLLKQFLSVGLEDFDNVMRGDGRTSRDYFFEHTKASLDAHQSFQRLEQAGLRFRLAHFALLASTVALLLLGLTVSISRIAIPFAMWGGVALFAIEIAAIFAMYVLGDSNED